MPFVHCTMCVTTRFSFLCLLFCVPSWIFGTRGTVAQIANETKSDMSETPVPPSSHHTHDHAAFQMNQTTMHTNVAEEQAKYFASLLFAKYGIDNHTLLRIELLNLFHNLGLDGQKTKQLHFDTSKTEHESVGEIHNHDFHEESGHNDVNKNGHTPSDKYSSSYKKDLEKNAHIHTNVSRLDHNDDRNIQMTENSSDPHHNHHQDHNVTVTGSDENHTRNTPVHEHDSSFPNSQNTTTETSLKPDSGEHKDRDGTQSRTGGKKRKGKAGRRAKKERKANGRKKKERDEDASKRIPRDISDELHHDHTECLTEILRAFSLETKDKITLTDFLYMSPAIIYQLDAKDCSPFDHGQVGSIVDMSGDDHIQDHDHAHPGHKAALPASDEHHMGTSNPAKVWGFSFLAVLIVSLVGLLGVAIIPLMHRVFYNHLLQFLVALAVGTLTGDALLHLFPHSINSSHQEDSHNHGGGELHLINEGTMTMKGLVAVLSLFAFYIMERILIITTDSRRKRTNKTDTKTSCVVQSQNALSKKLSKDGSRFASCEEVAMVSHPNRPSNMQHTNRSTNADTSMELSLARTTNEEVEVLMPSILSSNSHGHTHHPHAVSDADGDVGEPIPNSVAAIAWMVILGDGIHNFSDGLAIGAAFSTSITSGFSTSIAVFCHELPHEIGDFAVLLRAGMSSKHALIYNVVSSILCFFGMFVGIGLGNIHEASSWIFACVAGMFLYIALVDMLPEMTSIETKEGENPFYHLLCQCAGIGLGSLIMLLIAIYEEDLMKTFG
ncbi:zinc transporter ZIP10-like [Gigantopelta aegis]|uniref:zinc transporter ZIP10-like n=1 Tax=Gigantopelta aegis TaxID=1735272 RepID=UPI001B88B9CF|nr:zinc transporter ZIP10-like [Gigantopelta aegis]